jgi:flagella basal body P-ring formation protein FlgA
MRLLALLPVLLLALAGSAPAGAAVPAPTGGAGPAGTPADTALPGRQDPAAVAALARQFLEQQSTGLPGKVSIRIGALDARVALAACPGAQAFQLPGARPWGKTTVGVRCTGPLAWTIYLQAQVSVVGDYVAAAVALAQGQPIGAAQLVKVEGDLAALPAGVATDPAQVVGKTPTVSLAAGSPLRLDSLKSQPVVQQGQLVHVVSSGTGFSVSAEGRALGSAAAGQVVQVRTAAGAVVAGIAAAGGQVNVTF